MEEDAHFGDRVVAGDDQGAEEVVCCVGVELGEGGLGAGEDDGFGEVREEEGEGGGGVGEGVGAVEDDEGVVEGVVVL